MISFIFLRNRLENVFGMMFAKKLSSSLGACFYKEDYLGFMEVKRDKHAYVLSSNVISNYFLLKILW